MGRGDAMSRDRPSNWREWNRQRQEASWRDKMLERKRLRSRILKFAHRAVLGVLLFMLMIRLVGTGGVVRSHLGDFDSWAFWLRDSPLPVAVKTASVDAAGTLRLAVVNRRSAPGAAVLVDGSESHRFDRWYTTLRVTPGQTLTLTLDEDAKPVRIRVIAQQGVRFPRLGQEWSLVSGKHIIGTVALSTYDE